MWRFCIIQCYVEVTSIEKILNNLDVAKASRTDQISAKFLEDGALVAAIHLAKYQSVDKTWYFSFAMQDVKIKPLPKKWISIETKN